MSFAGDGRDEAHDKFITSLRINPSFPPAFTSLGIWYAEQASPPDEVRASKCYQKAFELDATEAEAAKRLAIGYAQESEWALVNTIAKRVIEGEGGLDGGLSGREKSVAVPKFLPTNAWAWKALGACQMVRIGSMITRPFSADCVASRSTKNTSKPLSVFKLHFASTITMQLCGSVSAKPTRARVGMSRLSRHSNGASRWTPRIGYRITTSATSTRIF